MDHDVKTKRKKVTPSNCFFCPNIGPTPKDSSLSSINNKQQILTFKELGLKMFNLFTRIMNFLSIA